MKQRRKQSLYRDALSGCPVLWTSSILFCWNFWGASWNMPQNWLHEGQNEEEFSIDSPLPFVKGTFVPLRPCVVPVFSRTSHTAEMEKPMAEVKRCTHRSNQVRWLSDWHCIKLAETCTELAVQTEVGIRESQVDESIMSRYLIQAVLVSNK